MGNEGVIPNVAVVDAGPIIHLAQVDARDLLSVVERVLVPRAVYVELSDEGLRSQLEAVGCDLVEVSVDESLASLDSGETAAIRLTMVAESTTETNIYGLNCSTDHIQAHRSNKRVEDFLRPSGGRRIHLEAARGGHGRTVSNSACGPKMETSEHNRTGWARPPALRDSKTSN